MGRFFYFYFSDCFSFSRRSVVDQDWGQSLLSRLCFCVFLIAVPDPPRIAEKAWMQVAAGREARRDGESQSLLQEAGRWFDGDRMATDDS